MSIHERRHTFIEVNALWQDKPRRACKTMVAIAHIQCVTEEPDKDYTRVVFAGVDDDSILVTESYHQAKDLIEAALSGRVDSHLDADGLSYANPGRNSLDYPVPRRP